MPDTALNSLPHLGVGLNYRPELAGDLLVRPAEVDFVEIITERCFDASDGDVIDRLAAAYPIVCHGLDLSIGTLEPLDRRYLEQLKATIGRIEPVWFSDHLSMTSANGVSAGHLVPLAFTQEVLCAVVEKIRRLQDTVALPFLLENITYYFPIPGSEMNEWDFVAGVAEAADCGLLLDLNNLFINARNHGYEPAQFLEGVPFDRVVEIHLGGAAFREGLWVDTHGGAVAPEVWEMLATVCDRTRVRAVVLERDQNIPPFAEIAGELRRAGEILRGSGHGPSRA